MMSMSTRVVLPSAAGIRLPARQVAGCRRAAALVVRAESKDSYEVQCCTSSVVDLHFAHNSCWGVVSSNDVSYSRE
jgi:hypothetical protein